MSNGHGDMDNEKTEMGRKSKRKKGRKRERDGVK